MAVKYVKEFDYPSEGGFHKSKMPSRAMPNAPARGAARMESKPKMGKGQGYAEGGKVQKFAAGSTVRGGRGMAAGPSPGSLASLQRHPDPAVATNAYIKGQERNYNLYQQLNPRDQKSMDPYAYNPQYDPAYDEKYVKGRPPGLAKGGKAPGREMDKLPAKKPPGRGKDLAPSKPERGQYQGYAKGGKLQKYAKGGKVQKFADGRLVSNPNVANPNYRVVPGGAYRGAYQTPVEMQWLQSWAKSQGMSPHKFESMVNDIIKAGDAAPAAIKAAGKSGMTKGLGVGTPLGVLGGALGTAYGPDIMNFLQSLMGRAKPTVTVEEIPQTPQGRARGGSIKKSYGRKR